jgi:hypothetical protein
MVSDTASPQSYCLFLLCKHVQAWSYQLKYEDYSGAMISLLYMGVQILFTFCNWNLGPLIGTSHFHYLSPDNHNDGFCEVVYFRFPTVRSHRVVANVHCQIYSFGWGLKYIGKAHIWVCLGVCFRKVLTRGFTSWMADSFVWEGLCRGLRVEWKGKKGRGGNPLTHMFAEWVHFLFCCCYAHLHQGFSRDFQTCSCKVRLHYGSLLQ